MGVVYGILALTLLGAGVLWVDVDPPMSARLASRQLLPDDPDEALVGGPLCVVDAKEVVDKSEWYSRSRALEGRSCCALRRPRPEEPLACAAVERKCVGGGRLDGKCVVIGDWPGEEVLLLACSLVWYGV